MKGKSATKGCHSLRKVVSKPRVEGSNGEYSELDSLLEQAGESPAALPWCRWCLRFSGQNCMVLHFFKNYLILCEFM